jgi:hypothetical protein
MDSSLAFWIIMLVWAIFDIRSTVRLPGGRGFWPVAPTIILLILLVILGWNAFGPPIHFSSNPHPHP